MNITSHQIVEAFDRMKAAIGDAFDEALMQQQSARIIPMLAAIASRQPHHAISNRIVAVAAAGANAQLEIDRYRQLHGAEARHFDAIPGLAKLFKDPDEAMRRIDRMLSAGADPLTKPADRIADMRLGRRLLDRFWFHTTTKETTYEPAPELVAYVQARRDLMERQRIRDVLPQHRRLLAFTTAAAAFGKAEAEALVQQHVNRFAKAMEQRSDRLRAAAAPARQAVGEAR